MTLTDRQLLNRAREMRDAHEDALDAFDEAHKEASRQRWLEHGGDEDGFESAWPDIREAAMEKQQARMAATERRQRLTKLMQRRF